MKPATARLDQVSVTGIEAFGHHGVFDHEKADGQRFIADVTLYLDTRRAAERDDLAEAVHYGLVADAVHAVLAGPSRDLVETVVDEIALGVLADPRVAAVDVMLHKPQAPVTVPFTDVTVTVHRDRGDALVATAPSRPANVVLGLGSNLGDREGTLAAAVQALTEIPGFSAGTVSPVFETDPVGGPEQPPYLNAVMLGYAACPPLTLLHACQDVEQRYGRERSVRWGPRSLDIDIVVFGDLVADTATLTLPHPRAVERAFVLLPWLAADPEAVLPGAWGPRRVADLVAASTDRDGRSPGVVPRHDLSLSEPAA